MPLSGTLSLADPVDQRSASRHMFCWPESMRHWHLEEQEQALCRRMGENLTISEEMSKLSYGGRRV